MKYIILILLLSSSAFANPFLGYWHIGKNPKTKKNTCMHVIEEKYNVLRANHTLEDRGESVFFVITHIEKNKVYMTIRTTYGFERGCITGVHMMIVGALSKSLNVFNASFGKLLDVEQCGIIARPVIMELALKRWVKISPEKYRALCKVKKIGI